MSPEQAIRTFLDRIPANSRLMVALSGGGDSTGLLAALSEARASRPDLQLHAATVDHGLRAGSADEAGAAARTCAQVGVVHSILTWQGAKPATGIQAAARAARYRLLADEALRVDADFIVAGHTIEDQRETLEMRRLRDPGAEQGMDAAVLLRRRIWLLRPLLGISRQAIRDYLQMRGLDWSEDPSNRNPVFERVRIRLSGATADHLSAEPDGSSDAWLAAAGFVRGHVKVFPGLVGVIDLASFDPVSPGHRLALLTLAAVIGGRIHNLGRESADKIVAALATGGNFRLAAGRVVFDRRKNLLHVTREARGLPDVTIPPGQRSDWDDRFEVVNHAATCLRIAAGRDIMDRPALLAQSPEGVLPGGVAARVAVQMPRIVAGEAGRTEVRTRLAPFEDFLPRRKLELADSIAAAVGLEPFPPLSLVNGSF